jgi:addiction module HigA family antidote
MIATSKKMTIRLPQNRPPVHPGEILAEEYMLPYNITQHEMAVHLKISRKHLIDIIHGRKPISLEVAQRLAKLSGPQLNSGFRGKWPMIYGMRCDIPAGNCEPSSL